MGPQICLSTILRNLTDKNEYKGIGLKYIQESSIREKCNEVYRWFYLHKIKKHLLKHEGHSILKQRGKDQRNVGKLCYNSQIVNDCFKIFSFSVSYGEYIDLFFILQSQIFVLRH